MEKMQVEFLKKFEIKIFLHNFGTLSEYPARMSLATDIE